MISLESEDRSIPDFVTEELLDNWLKSVVAEYGYELGEITVIFCSDDRLLDVNRQYLDHDYYTDIITFDYTEAETVSGDLFISLDRVEENAGDFSESFSRELFRVIVHGVLHLCGLTDKEEEAERRMRAAEESALSVLLT